MATAQYLPNIPIHPDPIALYQFSFMIIVSFLPLLLACSPPRTPLKVVPQIRIELDPEDRGFFWRSKGTETTL